MISLLNQIILQIISLLPKKIVYIFAGKYVAGENINTLIKATREMNNLGYDVILTFLVHVKDRKLTK